MAFGEDFLGGATGPGGGEFLAEQEGVRRAEARAEQLGANLAATPPPSTPQLSLPFLPELSQFLSALGAAREHHHAASQRLASFYQDAAASLGEFEATVVGQEEASVSSLNGVGGGVL